MLATYLHNSKGDWIGFKVGKFVYNKEGNCIGWLPWDEKTVLDIEGRYLGSIVDEVRLFYFQDSGRKEVVPVPANYDPKPGFPGYPFNRGLYILPVGASDIETSQLKYLPNETS